MAIKKAFEPLIEFLKENQNKSIKTVMTEIVTIASCKGRVKGDGTGAVSTFIKDTAGDTVAIFDYYFKRWMPLVGDGVVDFGAKASSASGFASMSKAGTSLWTKQQRVAKNAIEDILVKVESGELAPTDIAAEKEKIEATRKSVETTTDGFAERDEVIAYLEAEGVEFEAPNTQKSDED